MLEDDRKDFLHTLKGKMVRFSYEMGHTIIVRVIRINNPSLGSTMPFSVKGELIASNVAFSGEHPVTLYVKHIIDYEVLCWEDLPPCLGYPNTFDLLAELIKGVNSNENY